MVLTVTVLVLLAGASSAAPLVIEQQAPQQQQHNNSLWFYSLQVEPGLKRCGQINAAPFVPVALFEPRHVFALRAYVEATVKLYRTPLLNTSVQFGQCSSVGYTVCDSAVQGIGWTPRSIMGPICGSRCGCNFQGACSPVGNFPGIPSCENLPYCKDQPDVPAAGKFCSLCGPSTACPGCGPGATVTIELCNPTE
eukprot:SAG11_NODE_10045_length_861_cov_1.073491_1_plen_195_part_00